jgi:prepilin-type N-terminal cleavage/methylation domain-containing protein
MREANALKRNNGMKRPGFTLIELLVAMTLTLVLIGVVMQVFERIGKNVAESRSTLELTSNLRTVAEMLQLDLQGITVTPIPPRNVDDGYLEIIEGAMGVMRQPYDIAINSDILLHPENYPANMSYRDYTVIDSDDMLLFTTRSLGQPFTGRCQWVTTPDGKIQYQPDGGTIQSNVAEVAWFVRGRTLYRRVLLVAPWINSFGVRGQGLYQGQAADALPYPVAGCLFSTPQPGFYAFNDISVRNQNDLLIANTLGDLARRECRYGHDPSRFPYSAQYWGALGLPTARESSSMFWITGAMSPFNRIWPINQRTQDRNNDYWIQQSPNYYNFPYAFANDIFNDQDPSALQIFDNTNPSNPAQSGELSGHWNNLKRKGYTGTKPAGAFRDGVRRDDVVLNNVIGFDVKVWDPGAPGSGGASGAYVDLGYLTASYAYAKTAFDHIGDPRSYLAMSTPPNLAQWYQSGITARVYDTWTTFYQKMYAKKSDGFDSYASYDTTKKQYNFPVSQGIVDGVNELIAESMGVLPPYPAPLRGIQVRIRAFDPDSRQIREVTVQQDFLPK